jgi:hypothetical protein
VALGVLLPIEDQLQEREETNLIWAIDDLNKFINSIFFS